MRIFINKKYLLLPLDVHVSPDDFDKTTSLVLNGPDRKVQNHIIKETIGKASGIILKYKVNKRTLTKDIFLKEFTNPATLTEFYAYMEDQVKLRIGEITYSTAKQHLTALNKLREYKPGNCMMAEMDENLIRDFEKYLRKKGNDLNTIYSNLRNIKTYVNRAVKQELMERSPFRYYKLKKVKTYPEFLSESEVQTLFDLYNSNKLPGSYKNVLRWFLFACQTGLRISDLRAMKHENIKHKTLVFRPIKSANIDNKRIEVPLTSTALKLINEENATRLNGLIFDCITEQKMNQYIKGVIEVAKIDKKVSFHVARHTFATLFLKKSKRANGILILKELLGHSKLETTMVYSHVLEDDIKEAISEFDSQYL